MPEPLTRPVTAVLALACGVAVANVYFPQALSPLIAAGLQVSGDEAALVTTATQAGYAGGLLLLVPLGDRVPHRPLLVTLLALTGAGLLAAARSPGLGALVAVSVLIGLTTVVPQLIIPMAAGLVPGDRRGAVTGLLLSGLVAGILLARAFGGLVGEWLGWRAPYLLAAGFAWVLAGLLLRVLPVTVPSTREHYGRLVAGPLRLLATEPELRRSGLYQAMLFAGFSAAWTALALLVTGPRYSLGTPVLGLLGVVGAASVLAAPYAGRAADRRGPDRVTLACLALAAASAPVLLTGSLGGTAGLAGLAAGLVLLDVALQSSQVANQARIFALQAGARSRLNTAYMTCSFLGGAVGSWLGVQAYLRAGWPGVCGLLAGVSAVALAWHLAGLPRRHRATAGNGIVAADATNPTR